jgi:hypothetical protein
MIYLQRNTVARSRNHYCSGNSTFLCVLLSYATVDNTRVLSVKHKCFNDAYMSPLSVLGTKFSQQIPIISPQILNFMDISQGWGELINGDGRIDRRIWRSYETLFPTVRTRLKPGIQWRQDIRDLNFSQRRIEVLWHETPCHWVSGCRSWAVIGLFDPWRWWHYDTSKRLEPLTKRRNVGCEKTWIFYVGNILEYGAANSVICYWIISGLVSSCSCSTSKDEDVWPS